MKVWVTVCNESACVSFSLAKGFPRPQSLAFSLTHTLRARDCWRTALRWDCCPCTDVQDALSAVTSVVGYCSATRF